MNRATGNPGTEVDWEKQLASDAAAVMAMEESATHANREHISKTAAVAQDSDAARVFLQKLDKSANSFTFQTFDDDPQRKDSKHTRILHGSLKDCWGALCRLNDRGAGVFVTINETDGAGRKAENITRARAVFEEQDTPNKPATDYPLKPHIEVESSPGKFHRYWLTDGLDLGEWQGIQARIAERYQGDPSAADGVNRVMRLPGFLHQKNPAAPHMVRITRLTKAHPHRAKKIRDAFPPAAINGHDTGANTRKEKPKLGIEHSPVLQELDRRGHLLRANPAEGWDILCPWHTAHTTGPDGTIYYEPHTGGFAGHGFKCQHSHCTERTAGELLDWLGIEKSADTWPEITPLPERGGMGAAAPYPLGLLPTALRTAAGEVARFSKVPEASPAVIGLSVIAAAIGKRAVVIERDGLEHYPALFFALVAPSGERKSPPYKLMHAVLEQWAEDQRASHEAQTREAKATNDMIDARAKKLKSDADKVSGDLKNVARGLAEIEACRVKLPPYPSLFTTDITEQRLFQKMHDRDGAYAVMSGEGRPVLDAIMGKYSGDGRTGDAIYLAGISGDTITRDRVGGDNGPEERVVTRPCLNVCIMVQPDKYLEAAGHPSLRASGALARISPLLLPKMAGSRFERESDKGLDPALLADYTRIVRGVLDHHPKTDKAGRITPHRARLADDAAAARREFHNAIEADMGEAGELADVSDIASKAVSQTCKLALVLHIAQTPSLLKRAESTISLKIWKVAQALGWYHLQEAVRVQRLAEEDTSLEEARRVLRWIAREGHKEVTTALLMQSGPRPRPKAKHARDVLDMLQEYGYLKDYTPANRRRPVYKVNPVYLAILANLAGGEGEN